VDETKPTSTLSGFRFGKFCSTKLLCLFFSVVIGLGCSAFALSSYGSAGVSELLDAVSVPDATAIPVSNRTGAQWLPARPDSPARALVYLAGSRPLQHHAKERVQPDGARNGVCTVCGAPTKLIIASHIIFFTYAGRRLLEDNAGD